MKKFILFLLVLVSQTFAEESAEASSVHQAFGYVDIGLEFPIYPTPALGFGFRSQWNHSGVDLALRVASLGQLITQAKGSISYLHYPHPNLDGQFYWGLGVGVSWVRVDVLQGVLKSIGWDSSSQSLCLSPEIILGKQYKTSSGKTRFWQFQTSFPTYAASDPEFFTGGKLCQHRWLFFPLITFSYGFGF